MCDNSVNAVLNQTDDKFGQKDIRSLGCTRPIATSLNMQQARCTKVNGPSLRL